jgi:hypothetical protein
MCFLSDQLSNPLLPRTRKLFFKMPWGVVHWHTAIGSAIAAFPARVASVAKHGSRSWHLQSVSSNVSRIDLCMYPRGSRGPLGLEYEEYEVMYGRVAYGKIVGEAVGIRSHLSLALGYNLFNRIDPTKRL